MKMKKIFIFILSLVICLILTGCWDRTEVDQLAIVVALGIDKIPGPEPFQLTAQIVNPSILKQKGSSVKGKPFLLTTSRGKTIGDAVERFKQYSPRRLFFSHIAIVVFGGELARSGIQPTLDYMARERQIRRSIWMLVTPKTAQEILHAKFEVENIPAVGIEQMILQSKRSSLVSLVQRKDFIRDITSKSHSTVIPRIDLIGQREDEGQQEKTEAGRNPQLKGQGIFVKKKLVGYLTDDETSGRLWILGEMNQGTVVFPCKRDNGKVVVKMNSMKSKFTPLFTDGKVKMSINVEVEGAIKEVTCPEMQVTKKRNIKELERKTNMQIEQEMRKSIQKAQHLKADIFGFGNQIYRDHPGQWRYMENNWDRTFSRMEVDIHVISIIRQVGVTQGAPE